MVSQVFNVLQNIDSHGFDKENSSDGTVSNGSIASFCTTALSYHVVMSVDKDSTDYVAPIEFSAKYNLQNVVSFPVSCCVH